MSYTLLPRGWHIVSHRPDGRSEHYTPEMLDRDSVRRLNSNRSEDVQLVVDTLAHRLGTHVDAFRDGELIARSGRDLSLVPATGVAARASRGNT